MPDQYYINETYKESWDNTLLSVSTRKTVQGAQKVCGFSEKFDPINHITINSLCAEKQVAGGGRVKHQSVYTSD